MPAGERGPPDPALPEGQEKSVKVLARKERSGSVGMRDSEAAHNFRDGLSLGAVALEELQPRRVWP